MRCNASIKERYRGTVMNTWGVGTGLTPDRNDKITMSGLPQHLTAKSVKSSRSFGRRRTKRMKQELTKLFKSLFRTAASKIKIENGTGRRRPLCIRTLPLTTRFVMLLDKNFQNIIRSMMFAKNKNFFKKRLQIMIKLIGVIN